MTRVLMVGLMASGKSTLYAEVAHQVLETDRLSPAQAAREVVAAVQAA